MPNAIRPTYDPLNTGLETQGLMSDSVRGVSSSGARRSSSYDTDSQGENTTGGVFGILTPQGQQFVMDDNVTDQFIRLRTKSGTQILINDTTGCIYMISRDGESWMELGANGSIDMYAGADVSIRSKGSINLKSDGDFNVDAGGTINMISRSAGGINLNSPAGEFNLNTMNNINMTTTADSINYLANKNIKVTAQTGEINIQSSTDTNIITGGNRKDTVKGNWDRKASGNIYEGADRIQQRGTTEILLQAPVVFSNPAIIPTRKEAKTPDAAQSNPASTAGLPVLYNLRDSNGAGVNVTVRRMPYHEPYADHGTGSPSGKASSYNSVELTNTSINPTVYNDVANTLPPATTNYPGMVKPGTDYALWTYQGLDQSGESQYKKGDMPDGLFNEVDFYQGMSTEGLAVLIQYYEGTGERPPAGGGPGRTYRDPGNGKPDIGYGHTLLPDEAAGWYVNIGGQKIPVDKLENGVWVSGNPTNPSGVPALTNDQMTALLLQDVNNPMRASGEIGYAAIVRNAVRPLRYNGQPIKLTQNQFDVLVDLVYNGQSQWKVILDALVRGEGYKIPALIQSDPPLKRYGGLKPRGIAEARWWSALPSGFTYGIVDSDIVLNDVIQFGSTDYAHFVGLTAGMQSSILQLANSYKTATGNKLIINSAYRSQAEQTRLYNIWIANGGGPNNPTVNGITTPAQKSSAHGAGIACDINQTQVSYCVANGLLGPNNLYQPFPSSDPIHIQYRTSSSYAGQA